MANIADVIGLIGRQCYDLDRTDGGTRYRRLVAAGRCGLCGGERGDSPSACYCQPCYRQTRERKRRDKGCKPWVRGGRGRPPRDAQPS